jgi:hypothetical protein
VSNFIEHDARLGRLGVLWTAIFFAGLLMASVWDGDGNPNTENLPQATVTLAPRSVRTADEKTAGDEGNDPSDQNPRRVHRPRHRRFGLRELRRRCVAVPSRGPPEGVCHG